ncbi:hypothetical protein BO86DRAFT_337313 [Aspergillus japonicus CBS 114.51]|uniref:Uncharacterized protein n=2 Tax=Aspergillus TaxID=5052 RepID=A0A2V5HD60_ASPV1|nr:hypothetical protein BO86DRAFT_337313 [Aspergillus japonicus CBS 114.51]PYI19203.1 hypothetical protein BO99DRAFT_384910 [Aspergillus violaceofuscus CBS 115571]RAH82482.1 hypothetical protein BO86DRAFT_337313 [Aspergillus japonicus CBS 114.51]
MPLEAQSSSLASDLVARFLRTHNYTETLDAFLREAGLPANAGQIRGKDEQDSWTIEGVLDEKRAFDKSVNFERYNESDQEKDFWSVPAPTNPTVIQTPTSSNLLSCSVEQWQHDDREEQPDEPFLVATGADKQLHVFQASAGNALVRSFSGTSESPILSYTPIREGKFLLLTNMSGQLLLQRGASILDRRKDHAKYAVKVVAHEADDNTVWIATAGWDSKVFLYQLRGGSLAAAVDEHTPVSIGAPVAQISLPTNPESILFVRHADTKELLLLVSRQDSTYIYYYQVGGSRAASTAAETTHPHQQQRAECVLLGRQNLAPHSNAWVAFSPSCIALSPHDAGLIAVATSTLPHMKVMIVRLLFPSQETLSGNGEDDEPVTQAAQALAALSLQNREDAAIMVQANTFAPQTAYSTPQVVWRPDGSGVWVNGDDGAIRGLEAKSGRVVTVLKGGHEAGCKIRAIWAGRVEQRSGSDGRTIREEWLVSGGFDKRLVVWKI